MSKHTALPWLKDIWRDDRDNSIKRVTVVQKGFAFDGYTVVCLPCGADDTQMIANAEFIVRACNSHYQLVHACEKLIKWRENCEDLPTDIDLIGAYQSAKAVIAIAKGEL